MQAGEVLTLTLRHAKWQCNPYMRMRVVLPMSGESSRQVSQEKSCTLGERGHGENDREVS